MDLSISSSLDLVEARDGAGGFDGEQVKSGLSSVEVVGVRDKRGSGEEGTGIGASLQSWPH